MNTVIATTAAPCYSDDYDAQFGALENLGFQNLNATRSEGAQSRDTTQQFGFQNLSATRVEGHEGRDTTEQFGFQNLNALRSEGTQGRDTTERFGFQGLNAIHREGYEGRDTTEKFGFQNLNATRFEGHEGREETEKFGLYNAKQTNLYGLKNLESIKDLGKELLLEGCKNTDHITDAMNTLGSAIALQNANNTASIISNQIVGFKDGALQAATLAAEAQLAMATNTAAIQLAATVNAKDAALAAAMNAADLSRQLAECCCEQKALTLETANRTDQLIRQVETDRVRDELNAARDEITALKIRASLEHGHHGH